MKLRPHHGEYGERCRNSYDVLGVMPRLHICQEGIETVIQSWHLPSSLEGFSGNVATWAAANTPVVDQVIHADRWKTLPDLGKCVVLPGVSVRLR